MRALLLIADIGGYTRFMKVHRINLGFKKPCDGFRNLDEVLPALPGEVARRKEG